DIRLPIGHDVIDHEALHADFLAPIRSLLRIRLLVDIQARGHQEFRTRGPRGGHRQGAHEERTTTPNPSLTITFPCVRIHVAIPCMVAYPCYSPCGAA